MKLDLVFGKGRWGEIAAIVELLMFLMTTLPKRTGIKELGDPIETQWESECIKLSCQDFQRVRRAWKE